MEEIAVEIFQRKKRKVIKKQKATGEIAVEIFLKKEKKREYEEIITRS